MKKEFEYKEKYSLATCACLNVTDDCNLACKYCFVQQKPNYMSLQVAKDTVDYLVNNLITKDKKNLLDYPDEMVGLTFFGGEPTLLWEEIIVPTVLYAKEKYPKLINFTMTTNGTMLTKDKIDFLKKYEIFPMLSIDGNKNIQDINRPCKNGDSSFDLVDKNIDYLLANFPNTVFRATIEQSNCQGLFENSYLFAIERGFKNIFLCPNAREEWSEDNLTILHDEINKIWTFIALSFLEEQLPIQYARVDEAFEYILRTDLQNYYKQYEVLTPYRNVMRCGLGSSSFSIAYDGKIYACQEQDSRSTNDYFHIGNIYSGIDIKKHSQILQDFSKPYLIQSSQQNQCDTCILRKVCIDDICPSVSYDRFNNFFTKPSVECYFNQWMFNNATTVMDFLVKENNITFQKYLDNIFKKYLKEGQ